MRAQDIVGRGVQTTKYEDKTFSYDGVQDFKQVGPEIYKIEPKGSNLKPRTRASKNNSYT